MDLLESRHRRIFQVLLPAQVIQFPLVYPSHLLLVVLNCTGGLGDHFLKDCGHFSIGVH